MTSATRECERRRKLFLVFFLLEFARGNLVALRAAILAIAGYGWPPRLDPRKQRATTAAAARALVLTGCAGSTVVAEDRNSAGIESRSAAPDIMQSGTIFRPARAAIQTARCSADGRVTLCLSQRGPLRASQGRPLLPHPPPPPRQCTKHVGRT